LNFCFELILIEVFELILIEAAFELILIEATFELILIEAIFELIQIEAFKLILIGAFEVFFLFKLLKGCWTFIDGSKLQPNRPELCAIPMM
jgi:hypothetical protein